MLGEELLIITSEFDRFDRSNNRLDVMALDKEGVLTIIELKLDASRTLADLQAIRYAAFCSNMTMADIVEHLAQRKGISQDEASETVRHFLDTEVLPELQTQPRIILAAGVIDDQALTSTVLWLRRFGVNISCVELTPYRISEINRIVLVPRVLIPLPEAQEYLVNVVRKETSLIRTHRQDTGNKVFWRAVADAFNAMDCPFKARPPQTIYMRLSIRMQNIHYEWQLPDGEKCINVCLDSEFSNHAESLSHIAAVIDQWETLTAGIKLEKSAGTWQRKWAEAKLILPFSETDTISQGAQEAAQTMKILFDRTYSLLHS